MSLTEIKDHVAELSVDERLELAAWIVHLNRAADAEYQTELDRRMMAMDAGRKTSQGELEHRHEELSRRGQ